MLLDSNKSLSEFSFLKNVRGTYFLLGVTLSERRVHTGLRTANDFSDLLNFRYFVVFMSGARLICKIRLSVCREIAIIRILSFYNTA